MLLPIDREMARVSTQIWGQAAFSTKATRDDPARRTTGPHKSKLRSAEACELRLCMGKTTILRLSAMRTRSRLMVSQTDSSSVLSGGTTGLDEEPKPTGAAGGGVAAAGCVLGVMEAVNRCSTSSVSGVDAALFDPGQAMLVLSSGLPKSHEC